MGRSDASRAIYLIKRGESLFLIVFAMYLIDRDGTILSTSTDAEELEALIKAAIERE
jgi:hypothetical protein